MNQNNKKKEPWRIAVFIIAVVFIVFLWIKKDIAAVFANTQGEDFLPLLVTTLAVSLLKIAIITAAILLIKWIVGKIIKK